MGVLPTTENRCGEIHPLDRAVQRIIPVFTRFRLIGPEHVKDG